MSDRHVLPPYSLRMTAELRQMLEESAGKTKRSLNAEIIARLEESFRPRTLDEVESAKTQELGKELATLSIESFRLNQLMDDLLEKAKTPLNEDDTAELESLVVHVAEKIGKVERTKHQKLMALELLKR